MKRNHPCMACKYRKYDKSNTICSVVCTARVDYAIAIKNGVDMPDIPPPDLKDGAIPKTRMRIAAVHRLDKSDAYPVRTSTKLNGHDLLERCHVVTCDREATKNIHGIGYVCTRCYQRYRYWIRRGRRVSSLDELSHVRVSMCGVADDNGKNVGHINFRRCEFCGERHARTLVNGIGILCRTCYDRYRYRIRHGYAVNTISDLKHINPNGCRRIAENARHNES